MEKKYSSNSECKVPWAVKTYTQWRLHSMQGEDSDERLSSTDVHDVKTLDKSSLCLSMYKFITEVI